ncbi:MAG: ATP-binding protein [Rhodospirillaceae bacterium]
MSLRPLKQDFHPSEGPTDLETLVEALPASEPPARKKPIRGIWILACALFGVAASLAAFALLSFQSWRNAEAVWEAQTRNYRDALQQNFSSAQILLYSLRGNHAGTRTVSRAGFESLAAELKRFFPSLHIVAWVPRIKVRDIAATERAAAAAGLPAFKIRNLDGPVPDAAADDDLFVVFFEARGSGNFDRGRSMAGVNLLSMPGRRQILQRACTSGDVLAANWPTLLDQSQGLGYLILYLAVYDADLAGLFPYQACPKLAGYFTALMRLDVLMVTAFRTQPQIEADIYLADPRAPRGQRVIGYYGATQHPPGFEPLRFDAASRLAAISHWMEVGGLELTLMFVPRPRHWTTYGSGAGWAVLVFGLLLTAALTAFLAKQRSATRHLMAEVDRRFKLEQALRASEYRFRLALRDSNVSVFSQDRDLRYTWIFNPNVIGLEPKDFIGRQHTDLFPEGGNLEMEALKKNVIASGISARREVPLMIGGRKYVRDLRIEALHDRTGAITGIICVAIDVTEARLMKEELSRAVAVAERANAAKSRFLAAASHDLRQPFQAMLLFHELLRSRLADPLHLELCDRLGDSIRAGRELLTALLDISTLDAGIVTPKMTSFPLQASLEALVAEFREQGALVGIGLRLVPTQVTVRSDRVLLERILRNLLANALRYGGNGRILIGCRRRPAGVEIQVWDTGIGIPADQLDLIFEDFYQVGNPERRLTQGLGLGLGIVARTASLLGHTVAVRSAPGRGSVFSVTAATVAGNSPTAAEPPPEDPEGLPRQHILVIEDDDMQRNALRMLLEEAGHSVLAAASPAEAGDLIKATPLKPSLIISDLRLPGPLSGVEAIALMRALIGAPVPAVLATGDTDEHQLRHAATAGAVILHKPFNLAGLMQVLSALMPTAAGRKETP